MNLINTFSLPSLLYGLNFTPNVLYLLPHSSAGRQEMVVAVGSSLLSLPFLTPQGRRPHTLPLLQHGVPLTGNSPPWTSSRPVPPTGCSSSQTAPLWVPPGHKSCQQTGSSVGSSLHRCCKELPNAGFPQGHSLLWASTCSSMGSSMGCRWISALPWTSMGTICLTMVFITSCRWISAPAPGVPPPPPSALILVCRADSYVFSPHSTIPIA